MTAIAIATLLAGAPVQFCVGSSHGSITACAERFAELPSEVDGRLFAMDRLGNTADWGPFCSWRGVHVQAVGAELGVLECDEAKRRLDDAADSLTRAELVPRDEWTRVRGSALRGVVLYPARVFDGPRGEELVEGVYVPGTAVIHLTANLEAAPHELFHAVLRARGGSIDHDAFNRLVDFVQGAFAAKYRRRPAL